VCLRCADARKAATGATSVAPSSPGAVILAAEACADAPDVVAVAVAVDVVAAVTVVVVGGLDAACAPMPPAGTGRNLAVDVGCGRPFAPAAVAAAAAAAAAPAGALQAGQNTTTQGRHQRGDEMMRPEGEKGIGVVWCEGRCCATGVQHYGWDGGLHMR